MEPIKQELTRDTYEHGEKIIVVSKDDFFVPGLSSGVKIPYFGCVTSKLTQFWLGLIEYFRFAKDPFISFDTLQMPQEFRKPGFLGQSMLMEKLEEVPVEFNVHCYVGERTFQSGKDIWGDESNNWNLYDNLVIPRVFLTEKNENGEYIQIGLEDLAKKLEVPSFSSTMLSMAPFIYYNAMGYAQSKGIIIANAVIKFGFDSEGYLAVPNEILTPNTSDMWYVDPESGKRSDIFSIRKWIKDNIQEDGTVPPIPENIIKRTSQEYFDLYKRLTGHEIIP